MRSDFLFRFLVLLLFAIATLYGDQFIREYKSERWAREFVEEQIKQSLVETFSPLWEDAKDLGSPDSVTWSVVRDLQNRYNSINKSIFIQSIGRVHSAEPAYLRNEKRFALNLSLAGYDIEAIIIPKVPDQRKEYIILSITTIIIGIIITFLFPSHEALRSFPLAKIYGAIFDRKVSATKPWGAWQLTHVGTGARLANITPNGYAQANDQRVIDKCLDGLQMAKDAVEQAFLGDIKLLEYWETESATIDEILRKIRHEMQRRPFLSSDVDVSRFVTFVRTTALSSVMIDVADDKAYRNINNGVRISKRQEPDWLIDGYYVFIPRQRWEQILCNISNGIRSAYSLGISHINVHADNSLPFIYIDFVVDKYQIDRKNRSRLKEFIDRPFSGNLEDLVSNVSGFGKILIMDNNIAFNLTDMNCTKAHGVQGVTVRLMLRRIAAKERDLLVRSIDRHI